MGLKAVRKMLAIVIAAALVLTSTIGVFAAPSPTSGVVSGGSAEATKTTSITVNLGSAVNAETYNVYVNGELKYKNVKGPFVTIEVSKNGNYTVEVAGVNKGGKEGEKTVVGKVSTKKKAAKVKAKRAGKKAVKVSWKKLKKVSAYKIAIYKDGELWKTVNASKKKTSKTIKKLTKGAKYKFVVTPVYDNDYIGIGKASKAVKAK